MSTVDWAAVIVVWLVFGLFAAFILGIILWEVRK